MTARNWFIFLVLCLVVAFLGYVGPADYADALSTEADMKLLRAQIASRSEHITPAGQVSHSIGSPASRERNAAEPVPAGTILPLLHPLGCGGAYIRNCADFGSCRVTCLEE